MALKFQFRYALSFFINSSSFYGSRVNKWSASTSYYLKTSRKSLFLIDVAKSVFQLRRAVQFLRHLSKQESLVLFLANPFSHLDTFSRSRRYRVTTLYKAGYISNYRCSPKLSLPSPPAAVCLVDRRLPFFYALAEAQKLAIPTIGVAPTSSDLSFFTYPIVINLNSSVSLISVGNLLFRSFLSTSPTLSFGRVR